MDFRTNRDWYQVLAGILPAIIVIYRYVYNLSIFNKRTIRFTTMHATLNSLSNWGLIIIKQGAGGGGGSLLAGGFLIQ